MNPQFYNKLIADLKRYPVVLYIGKNVPDTDVELIKTLKWGGIVTARTDNRFAELFRNDQLQLQEIFPNTKENIRPLIDNQIKVPIFRLFGLEGIPYVDEDDFLDTDDYADSFFDQILSCIDSGHRLVVWGFEAHEQDDYPFKSLMKKLINLPKSSVQFWGCQTNENEKKIREICGQRKFIIVKESLSDSFRENDSSENHFSGSVLDDLFYCNGNAINYNRTHVGGKRSLATLLTEREVFRLKLSGETELREKYLDFLDKTSTEGPQWYGYYPETQYYVPRQYEKNLYDLVIGMLKGTVEKHSENLVLLQGYSGSSKSVVLGSIAYHIFVDKQFPVVYINRASEDIELFWENSTRLQELNTYLKSIENMIGAKSRILLIWDCSSYTTETSNMIRLMNYLRNDGRRFVLLCSSHITKTKDNNISYWKFNRTKQKAQANKADYQFYEKGICYCVTATSVINATEKKALRNSFEKNTNINRNVIDRIFSTKEDEKDYIHNLFYQIIRLIRPNIEKSLSRQEDEILSSLVYEINCVLQDSKKDALDWDNLSPMKRLLLEAGYGESLPETSTVSVETVEKVFLLIAMFSKFKLKVPYSLVMNQLDVGFYAENGARIQDLFTNIPLLYYHENTFSFRNSFEAQIFLMNKDPEGEKEFHLLCEILEGYSVDLSNREVRTLLLDYLRLMGPNSDHIAFSERMKDRDYFKEHMHTLVQALRNMLDDAWNTVDLPALASLVRNYLTFTREFYQMKLSELFYRNEVPAYKAPIDDLLEAQSFALDMVENINQVSIQYISPNLSMEKRSIVTEYAFISNLLNNYIQEYKGMCERHGNIPEAEYSDDIPFDYMSVYKLIVGIIPEDPTNGYIYNALFTCFESAYEHWENIERFEQLNQIMVIISDCDKRNIVNTGSQGSDEFENHILSIYEKLEKFDFSIETVKRRQSGITVETDFTPEEKKYFKLYDKWLSDKNPVAISLLCFKELRKVKALDDDDNNEFSIEAKIEQCKKVIDFMTGTLQISKAVFNREYSLSLLIKAKWMCYNKRLLSAYQDRKQTYLTIKQWDEIEKLCYNYFEKFGTDYKGGNAKKKHNIIILLYAIAKLHLCYREHKGIGEVVEILNSLKSDNVDVGGRATRIITPYMFCDESGKPYQFSGIVNRINRTRLNEGRIILFDLDKKIDIFYNSRNFGFDGSVPSIRDRKDGLEIGIGYKGMSLYTAQGRKDWDDND